MKNTYLLFISFITYNHLNAQGPVTIWDNAIGGTESDKAYAMSATADGGLIIGGSSDSDISGDKTENSYGAVNLLDYWIIKTDALSNIEWQNTIGGTDEDELRSIQQTADGGYIVGGFSESPLSGEKTEANTGGGTSNADYWVIKLNASGVIVWQNTIGGTGDEELYTALPTADGGYILGGSSNSNISGDKTQNSFGNYDYWIVKLDVLGNITWQKTIGGLQEDRVRDIVQTADGNYIVAGYSYSGISGNKTEPNVSGLNTTCDYWVMKLDATGNIIWQNTIGGNDNDHVGRIALTTDGGVIIGGHSESPVSGDKTENIHGTGGYTDYWVVKLNASGIPEWQNVIGGDNAEFCRDIIQTTDGGYLVAGLSWSNAGFEKSENQIGNHDYWIVKMDATGNRSWDNTMGGQGADYAFSIVETADDEFVIGGETQSWEGYDKSEDMIGNSWHDDIWLIKVGLACITETCNLIDDDCDAIIDDGITETISISTISPLTFCDGGYADLVATYTGTAIQWKRNGNNISGATDNHYSAKKKGHYTCETTSACGSALSTSIFVNVIKAPPASITAGGPTTFCEGGSVVLTANTGPDLSYQWSKNGVAIAGATLINYTAMIEGNYKCRVIKTATGCYTNSNTIEVSITCREEELTNNSFTIYPNPATDKLIVEVGTRNQEPGARTNSPMVITDITGKIVFTGEIISSIITIDLSQFSAGMYFIKIDLDGEEQTQKFIKQ